MRCNRGPQATQTNGLDKYTVQLATTGSVRTVPDPTGGSPGSGDPSLREIMDAIQTLRNNIELKIDVVALDVILLRADLRKVTDKVTAAEGQINGLQAVNQQLEKQVQDLKKKQTEMEAKLEGREGRARCNIRMTGVPEGAEGHCTELFVEDFILNKLGPKRLSNYFTIERAHRVPA
ncbi:hypothetical protein NDU88_003250 [Pleurodeles waltl]|uniref:Uncharacterized protein n=1 Tax=Pleurodeles waltl TaxID=8319 RepID=A0AAV7W1L3_PLEWA|nr:hypothetical protein NDU88_003250 [Pleurodeles waltl]